MASLLHRILKRPSHWSARFVLLALPLILVGTLLMSRPEQVSETLLKSGGRIVSGLTTRPARTAAVSGAVLLLVWTAIGCRCLIECARDEPQRDEPSLENHPTHRAPLS